MLPGHVQLLTAMLADIAKIETMINEAFSQQKYLGHSFLVHLAKELPPAEGAKR
jgi:hypothetical protein